MRKLNSKMYFEYNGKTFVFFSKIHEVLIADYGSLMLRYTKKAD